MTTKQMRTEDSKAAKVYAAMILAAWSAVILFAAVYSAVS